MTDIVERLRKGGPCIEAAGCDGGGPCKVMNVNSGCACAEAADEIERLRAALAHIYAWYPISISQPRKTLDEMREFARAALEGKQ